MLFRRQSRVARRRSLPYFRIKKKVSTWFLVFVILFAVFFPVIWLVEYNIRPLLIEISKTEVEKIAQDAMIRATRQMQSDLGDDLNRTMTVEKGTDGKISFLQINNGVQTKIYETVASGVQAEMKQLQPRRIRLTIGQILQSSMFAEYGLKIPLQIWPKGSVKVSLVPKMESQGINTVMVTLNLLVENRMEMVVPFSRESVAVHFQYPIAQAVVVGEVPEYYFYNDQGQIKKAQGQTGVIPPPPTIKVED